MDTIISNPTWTIALPDGWSELTDQDSGLHFTSADGEQDLFIATWTMAPGSMRTARDLADDFVAYDLRELGTMEEHQWRTLAHSIDCAAGWCWAIIDSIEETEQYRIVSKIITRDGQAVRATLHDYACTDLCASQALFAPIVASLVFTPSA